MKSGQILKGKDVMVKVTVISQDVSTKVDCSKILSGVQSYPVRYDWDDPNPDAVIWRHLLERELAKKLRRGKIPWPRVKAAQEKLDLKHKKVEMTITVPGRMVIGSLSWK